jgi:hypothetical protein
VDYGEGGVQDVFYQVFDKGTMKDDEGRDIDIRNTIILTPPTLHRSSSPSCVPTPVSPAA